MVHQQTEADRSLPPVLAAVRDFERMFADAIQHGKDVQLKLTVATVCHGVKFVRLTEDRNYELDSH